MRFRILVGLLFALISSPVIWAQAAGGGAIEQHWDATTGAPQEHLPDRTTLAGMVAQPPDLYAKVRPDERAKSATVEVLPVGVELVSPPASPRTPSEHQGYLSYKLDNAAPVTSAASKWTFDNVAAGHHVITVELYGLDGRPMTDGKKLTFEFSR
jgi:hypothetical protein